ncbi:MAG: SMP-30/gluconolactonase/LRE family protein [Gammaproteobacteria bacterium]|nr:SMP-30/gluconolactonase/LRE family protein [Gammaproteobacteria bacterium]
MKLFEKQLIILVTFISILLISGCATAPATLSFIQPDGATSQVWPAKPETARYRYIGELIGEENFQSASEDGQNFAVQAFKWLVGLTSRKYQPKVLQRPQNGLVDSDGRILVTDVSRQAIYVFDKIAGKLDVWEMAEKNRRFIAPSAIVEDGQGGFLVTDAELGMIVRLDHEGRPQEVFADEVLVRPVGMARHVKTGRIYVADVREHKIKVLDSDGVLLETWGEHGETIDALNTPTYLSLVNDQLYITDTFNSRVKVLDLNGKVLKIIGKRGLYVGDLPRPKGVAVDTKGHIYVMESYYDHLLIYNQEGDLLLPIGGSGHGVGQFYLPAGVWTGQGNRIYIADMFNGRVVIFQYLEEDNIAGYTQ